MRREGREERLKRREKGVHGGEKRQIRERREKGKWCARWREETN